MGDALTKRRLLGQLRVGVNDVEVAGKTGEVDYIGLGDGPRRGRDLPSDFQVLKVNTIFQVHVVTLHVWKL